MAQGMRGVGRASTAIGCLAIVVAAAGIAGFAQDSRDRQVVVTVMNLKTGQPVTGVTPAALTVREDGGDRAIVKVEPASAPMSVVLLADNTAAFIRYGKELRSAAQTFLGTFMAGHAGSAASLWTFSGAAVPATQFLTDAAKLGEEADKLRPRDIVSRASDAESKLLEGVYDAAQALGKRPETRRVVVSFNAVTPLETSRLTKQQIQNELQKTGVSWFAVTFADGGSSSPLRDSIMTEVLPQSGGLRLTINDVTRLEPAMKVLADILSAQYVVTYTRPSGSPKEVQIEVKGEGLRAYYPRWAPK